VQQSFVVNSGTGVIKSGANSYELSKGKAFILAPGMDFTLTATGNNYMTFYVVTQKVPEGLAARTTLQVVDNTTKPQVTEAWYDKDRTLLAKSDGLSRYKGIIQVELPTMAMDRPYSDAPGVEEIWIATEGSIDMLFGKKLRKLTPGTAYRIPSTGLLAKANINVSPKSAEFLYMVSDNTQVAAGQ